MASFRGTQSLVGAIQNYLNRGRATLRARTTPCTDSPSHNGSSVQLDPALNLPDLAGFCPEVKVRDKIQEDVPSIVAFLVVVRLGQLLLALCTHRCNTKVKEQATRFR